MRVYVEFLKQEKYKEARDALENACKDGNDGYAFWFKARCIVHECLFYRHSSYDNFRDEVDYLIERSAKLGCPWAKSGTMNQ
jgi:hypothetical protein